MFLRSLIYIHDMSSCAVMNKCACVMVIKIGCLSKTSRWRLLGENMNKGRVETVVYIKSKSILEKFPEKNRDIFPEYLDDNEVITGLGQSTGVK